MFVVFGALGFAFSTHYWAMLLTRAVFGAGLELSIVAVSLLIVLLLFLLLVLLILFCYSSFCYYSGRVVQKQSIFRLCLFSS